MTLEVKSMPSHVENQIMAVFSFIESHRRAPTAKLVWLHLSPNFIFWLHVDKNIIARRGQEGKGDHQKPGDFRRPQNKLKSLSP